MNPTKSLFKWNRNRYKYTSFLVLTVVLLVIGFFQILYDNSYIDLKFGKTEETIEETHEEYSSEGNGTDFNGEKLVHLDLKGAPPKISFLLRFIPFIKKLGATGILIEYEDTFPYHSELEGLTALNAYTRLDVAAIIETARMYNLTVIPLIPTFAHFEFVLKLEEYKEFREIETRPEVLCPNNENVTILLHKMIDQVVEAHNTSKYLHIGCDEVNIIGACKKCRRIMKASKRRKSDIYFEHMMKIAEYINTTYPHIRPIVWADEFIKKNEKTIRRYRIPDLVDAMFWNYNPRENQFPKEEDIQSYLKMFKNIWIANAFKGATGSTQIITNIHYHLKNTKGWMNFYDKWNSKVNFKGIAITGWQRYNHFMVLCELLPVGIPSLALNLELINNRKGPDYDAVKHFLNCNDYVPVKLIEIRDLDLLSRLKCDFPGFRIYHLIHSLYNTLFPINSALNKLSRGDMAFFNIVHDLSNPAYVQKLNKDSYKRFLKELQELENEINTAFAEVYDESTTKEWIMTHVTPLRLRLEAATNIIAKVSSKKVWSRRPQITEDLKVKSVFKEICGKNETKGCTFFHI